MLRYRILQLVPGICNAYGIIPGPDIIIFNTCAIRRAAEEHVLGEIGALKNLKKDHPEKIFCLCGCMAQEEAVVEDAEISVNEEPVSEDNVVEEITEESSEEEYADEAEISDSVSVEITMDTDNNKPQQNYNSQKNFNKKKHRH